MSEKIPGRQNPELSGGADAQTVERIPQFAATAEALHQQMEDLKNKVKDSQEAKEKDIEKKLGDRESLIAEAKNNDELLAQANETLEYFTSMQELGQLTEQADIQNLQELQDLVTSLEKKRDEIVQTIEAISGRPEIQERLQDAAKTEDIERAVKATLEQAHAELDPKMDDLAKRIESLTFEEEWNRKDAKTATDEMALARQNVEKRIAEAKQILGAKSDLLTDLDNAWRSSRTAGEFEGELANLRKSLKGWFTGKEKAAIDYILNAQWAFDELKKGEEHAATSEEWRKKNQAKKEALADEYKAILLESWNIKDKVDQLTGSVAHDNKLGRELVWRMRTKMEILAGVRDKSGKQVQSWFSALHSGNDRQRERKYVFSQFYDQDKDLQWNDPRKHTEEPKRRLSR